MPTTSPVAPTSRAASIATSPTPEPRSSTRYPVSIPASRNNRSVTGASPAACRISRACSASVLPSAYSCLPIFSFMNPCILTRRLQQQNPYDALHHLETDYRMFEKVGRSAEKAVADEICCVPFGRPSHFFLRLRRYSCCTFLGARVAP